VLKKIGKKTSSLNWICNFVSVYRRIVHKSIIAPHFEYCATLMINTGETQLSMLQKTQNTARRVIPHCERYTKAEHMLQAVQFISTKQRLYYDVYLFIRY